MYCFASTLGSALKARGASIRSLTGRAVATNERDADFRTRVANIRIVVEADVETADLALLDKCEKIMERGCLVTYSLSEGIEVEHSVRWTSGK